MTKSPNKKDPENPEEKQPRKKRTYRKNKKTSEPVIEQSESVGINEVNNSEIRSAFERLLKQEAQTKNKSIKNTTSLEHLLSQYLNSFILIGYTQDTKEFISIVNAKSEQHADSLNTALSKFIQYNSKPQKNIPPFM